ncbi:MAG: hypothetical protein IJS22_09305 [Lachnospiraceae bacterium]|nr:hypothetical protein [Lachnospiraceae bacterium]
MYKPFPRLAALLLMSSAASLIFELFLLVIIIFLSDLPIYCKIGVSAFLQYFLPCHITAKSAFPLFCSTFCPAVLLQNRRFRFFAVFSALPYYCKISVSAFLQYFLPCCITAKSAFLFFCSTFCPAVLLQNRRFRFFAVLSALPYYCKIGVSAFLQYFLPCHITAKSAFLCFCNNSHFSAPDA